MNHNAIPQPHASTPTLIWRDEAATKHTAQKLAADPQLTNAAIALHGSLGAGKTTFARYLLQALGVDGRIKSPTYAVVETYETPVSPIWHFDFYRFNDPQEWEDAGFRDIFASEGLKLIEWAQQAGDLLPTLDLEFFITSDYDNKRNVHIQANTALGHAILSTLLPSQT